jgi:hypothetical protein
MNQEEDPLSFPRSADPEALAKALELELMLKRAAWQRASSSRSTWRAVSFFFLFLVIIATLFGFYYFFAIMPRAAGRNAAPESAAAPR